MESELEIVRDPIQKSPAEAGLEVGRKGQRRQFSSDDVTVNSVMDRDSRSSRGVPFPASKFHGAN
jgi:hypothetical protein